jgi:protein SCO1/2
MAGYFSMFSQALGHDGSAHQEGSLPKGLAAKDVSDEIELYDLKLVNGDGESVAFVSEALAGKVVVIDFIYTTCTTACPVLSSTLSIVQRELGARAGKEVWLISISIDPTRDTPSRVSDYARNFDGGEGWIWLTGKKDRIDRVLTGLGAYSAEIVDHPPMILVGDVERLVWRRMFGFPSPEDILSQVDELLTARAAVR